MFFAGFWIVATSHAASVMTPSRVRSSYFYVTDVQARANTLFLYHHPWWYEVMVRPKFYVVVLTVESEAIVNFLGIVR
jgi:hypothetical protein